MDLFRLIHNKAVISGITQLILLLGEWDPKCREKVNKVCLDSNQGPGSKSVIPHDI